MAKDLNAGFPGCMFMLLLMPIGVLAGIGTYEVGAKLDEEQKPVDARSIDQRIHDMVARLAEKKRKERGE
jgi:hypothetical protein